MKARTLNAVTEGNELTQGTRVGRYTLVREIASGGMATVFLARVGEGAAEREVAIKRLHPHLATEDDFVSMFFDEARLAARIHHPNVVSTLEIDDVDGLAIVMEYIEGVTLLELARDLARRKSRLPLPVATRIALDLLAGLHAAHELRDAEGRSLDLVHRDVSPHNVLVGVDGVSRITDFGIAKASVRLTSTRDGQTKGKLSYMAPEQLSTDDVDRRADVFAAGVVLWEIVTGRRLFIGSSDARIMHALVYGDFPSPRSVDPSISEELDAVVMRALSRDASARWSSCLEFATALKQVCSPCAPRVVGALALQAFKGVRAQREREASAQLTPVSAPRRIARGARAPAFDSTVLESVQELDAEEVEAIGDMADPMMILAPSAHHAPISARPSLTEETEEPTHERRPQIEVETLRPHAETISDAPTRAISIAPAGEVREATTAIPLVTRVEGAAPMIAPTPPASVSPPAPSRSHATLVMGVVALLLALAALAVTFLRGR